MAASPRWPVSRSGSIGAARALDSPYMRRTLALLALLGLLPLAAAAASLSTTAVAEIRVSGLRPTDAMTHYIDLTDYDHGAAENSEASARNIGTPQDSRPRGSRSSGEAPDTSLQTAQFTEAAHGRSSIGMAIELAHTMMTSQSKSATDHNPWSIWIDSWGPCVPTALALRSVYSDHWTRFYSLPRGSRAPRGGRQRSELLKRHSLVSSAVLGFGCECLVLRASHKDYVDVVEERWQACAKPPQWLCPSKFVEDFNQFCWTFQTTPWTQENLSGLLCVDRNFLMDEPVLVLSMATQGVYCPYEGGMDVFLANRMSIGPLQALFHEWRSPLQSGL